MTLFFIATPNRTASVRGDSGVPSKWLSDERMDRCGKVFSFRVERMLQSVIFDRERAYAALK